MKRRKYHTTWSLEQVLYLRSNYGKMTTKKLSEKLGRPVYSVYDKAKNLGLMKKRGGER